MAYSEVRTLGQKVNKTVENANRRLWSCSGWETIKSLRETLYTITKSHSTQNNQTSKTRNCLNKHKHLDFSYNHSSRMSFPNVLIALTKGVGSCLGEKNEPNGEKK